tara:strand:- start:153 stop:464 length:312 start_codon:yes stop_codon:yes gene_type:complete
MDTEEIMDVLLHELEVDLGDQWGASKDFFENGLAPFADKAANICNLFENNEMDFKESKKNLESLRPELVNLIADAEGKGHIQKGSIGEKFIFKSLTILTQFLE